MKSTILALAVGSLAFAGTAFAEKPINARQVNQERRIDAGVRSGKLTHAEAAKLRAQQASISRYERQLRAAHGGKLSAYDEHLVHARQDAANAAILKKKDNVIRGKDHLKL
jgi:hypothetical protein